jgi:hypothetical protein
MAMPIISKAWRPFAAKSEDERDYTRHNTLIIAKKENT